MIQQAVFFTQHVKCFDLQHEGLNSYISVEVTDVQSQSSSLSLGYQIYPEIY